VLKRLRRLRRDGVIAADVSILHPAVLSRLWCAALSGPMPRCRSSSKINVTIESVPPCSLYFSGS
jgi:hypothetical protein